MKIISLLGMAMRIYLAMRIDADIRIIRHMSDILSVNGEVDADIRIRMAIPNLYSLRKSVCAAFDP